MSSQVVFIDSRVPDIQDLLNGLKPGEQAFIIDGNRDGLDQIAAILKANDLTALAAISIVGHGASGEIDLGSTAIDENNLSSDAAALSAIGAALAPGGNLALYACDTAAGATGRQFISDLSAYAGGVDVTAATHLVGSVDRGGSWTLDASTGPAAAAASVPFSDQALANFQGSLGAPPAVTTSATAVYHGGDTAQTLDAGLTVTDASSTTLVSASVQIVGFVGGDMLNFADQHSIHGSYNASNGVLTLTGTDTLADYQDALRSITYSFAGNGDPAVGGANTSRSIYWVVNDGSATNETFPQAQAFNNDQPSLGLSQLVVMQGVYPSQSGGTGGIPMGALRTFAGDFAWGGTDLADGQLLSIAQNTALFSILGTNYGGNGQTNFGLPNLEARLAVGYENNPNSSLGQTYGSDHVTLTIQNMPQRWGGNGFAFSNDQPSLTVNYMIDVVGVYRGALATDVIGEVVPFLGNYAPGGYMLAQGQMLNISQNAALFSVLGTTYGGDGITTFALPNLTGRTIIGAGFDGPTTVALGTTAGQDSSTVATANLPVPKGSDQAISNSQPSLALTYLIATDGIFPQSTGGTPIWNQAYVGEIIAFAGTGGALDNMLSSGWAVANGATLPIDQYTTLYQLIGTTYGGDGGQTFALPDLVGRAVAGTGVNNQGTQASFGQSYGTSSITLTSNQLPLPVVATSTLDIVHTAPTVTAGATATFETGSPAVLLDAALTLSDVDSGGNLTGATISIGSGFVAGDTLHFTNQNGISGTYNSTTHVLTLSGTDTIAHYQTALDSITFTTTSASAGLRTIDWNVTDGSSSNGTSTTQTSTVNVTLGPALTVGTPNVTFTGGGAAVMLDGGLLLDDPSSTTLVGATVTISAGRLSGDVLSFNNGSNTETFGDGGTITVASFTGGVLSLTGTASLSDYQTALQQVQFGFTANGDPTGGAANDTSRTINWAVNDGTASNTATTTLDVVHVQPTVTAGGTMTFTGGGAAVPLDSTLTVDDVDSGGKLTGAAISIQGFIAGDTLNFNTQHGITGSYDSVVGVLTLSGTTSLANYQTALESITYSFTPANGDPTGGGSNTGRGINWVVSDGAVTNGSNPAALSLLQTAHAAPVVTAGSTQVFAAGGSPVVLDSTLTVSDPDSGGNLTGAIVQIFSGALDGDVLADNGVGDGSIVLGNIHASYDSATKILTLSGTDTLANYQTALQEVTYSFTPSNGDPSNGGGDPTRTIRWTVTDGSTSNGTSNAATSALNVGIAPVITSVTAATTGNATDLNAGKVVTITVNFSSAIDVTGVPELQLNDNEVASYTGGTGTTALSFSYTVQPNDNTADLQVQSLLLNGGTIQHGAGFDAVLTNASTDLHLAVDTTAPTASSISRAGGTPNHSSSETFTVTFSESVTGVDTSDFTAVTSGTADTGISVTPVSGSVYTVTVNGVTGDGTLGLNLNSSGTGIADLAGNAISGGFTGQVYTVGHTAPTVASITALGASPNHASSEQFQVTFSESVTGVVASDFALTTTNTAGGTALATAGISSITGSGTTYTVTVGGVSGDGTLRLDLKSNSTGITDAAGNGATAAFTGGEVYTIEHTPPSVSSIVANGASPNNAGSEQFTVTFSENVSGVDFTDFTATRAGTVADSGISVNGSGSTYTVTVNGVTGDGTLRLDLNTSGTGIADAAGNAISGGFTGGDVYTIQHTAPSVTSVGVPANATYVAGQNLDFTVNLSEGVTVTGTPEIALTLDTGGVVDAQYISGSGSSALTFRYTIVGGEGDANGIGVGSAILLNGGTVKDAATNAAVLTLNGVASTAGVLVDSIPPTLSSITTSGVGITAGNGDLKAGATVTLTLNESEVVTINTSGGTPTLQLNDGGIASYVGGSGTSALIFNYLVAPGDNTSDLAVDQILLHGATIQDLAGNNAALPGGTINPAGTLQIDTLAPHITAVTASPSSGTEGLNQTVAITVAFGEAVTVSGGTPTLSLNDYGTATYDATATAALHDASKLVFSYTVGLNDTNTSALAVTGINLHGAAIDDLAGNVANLNNIATTFTGLGVDSSSLVTANPDTNHVIAGQTVTADAAHGVLANDTDTNPADHVSVSAVNGLAADVNQTVAGAYGSLTMHADGSYSYTANTTVSGAAFDNFTYTASNGHAPPSTSTLTVEVIGANQNFVFVPSGGSATGGFGNTALDGSAGNATLTAATTFNAHQILIGGPGDTLNAASFGQDTFVFAGNFGHETINNFHPALDVIQLQQSQFGSLAAVMADIHQAGADSVLALDANHVVTITNTALSSLAAANFHLV